MNDLEENNKKLQQKLLQLNTHSLNKWLLSHSYGLVKDKKNCDQIYSFNDFNFLIGFTGVAFDVKYEISKKICQEQLTDFEQILATCAFMNTFWNQRTVGALFGINKKMLSK